MKYVQNCFQNGNYKVSSSINFFSRVLLTLSKKAKIAKTEIFHLSKLPNRITLFSFGKNELFPVFVGKLLSQDLYFLVFARFVKNFSQKQSKLRAAKRYNSKRNSKFPGAISKELQKILQIYITENLANRTFYHF